jgi:hypothetical protein
MLILSSPSSSGMCMGFLVLSVAALVGCCRAVPWAFSPLSSCDWRYLIGLLLFSSCVFACLVAMLPFFPPVIGVPTSSLLPCILLSSAVVCPSTCIAFLFPAGGSSPPPSPPPFSVSFVNPFLLCLPSPSVPVAPGGVTSAPATTPPVDLTSPAPTSQPNPEGTPEGNAALFRNLFLGSHRVCPLSIPSPSVFFPLSSSLVFLAFSSLLSFPHSFISLSSSSRASLILGCASHCAGCPPRGLQAFPYLECSSRTQLHSPDLPLGQTLSSSPLPAPPAPTTLASLALGSTGGGSEEILQAFGRDTLNSSPKAWHLRVQSVFTAFEADSAAARVRGNTTEALRISDALAEFKDDFFCQL